MLIQRLLDGDRDAFETLVVRHETALLRLVTGIVSDSHLAQDVVQEVFIIAYRQLSRFEGRARFRTWISRIAVREALGARSRLRRLWRACLSLQESGSAQELPAPTPAPGRPLEDREESLVLLAQLPEKERTAFVLFAEGFSYADIAEVMHGPMGSVATWIHRARKRLDVLVKERGYELAARVERRPDDAPMAPTRRHTP